MKYKTTNKLNISSWRLLNSFLSLSCQTLSWRFLWVKGMMGLYSQISPRNEHLCASHHYTPPPPAQCLAVQESFIQVKHELILWSLTFSWIILKKNSPVTSQKTNCLSITRTVLRDVQNMQTYTAGRVQCSWILRHVVLIITVVWSNNFNDLAKWKIKMKTEW